MAEQKLPSVKGGKSRNSFQVKWNTSDNKVYVKTCGWTYAGKASDAQAATRVAEAFVTNR